MAIYHCSVKTISRGKGQAVLASLAYRIGQNLTCQRYGKTFKYENRQGSIEHVDLFVPKDTSDLALYNHENLWNRVEQRETKSNSQLAREIVVAIPHELSEIERIQLVQKQCRWLVAKFGVAVSVAVHKPNDTKNLNYHAHIMFTTRKLENNEFTDKIEFKKAQVKELRQVWEKLANHSLGKYGTSIDCRSHNDAQNPKIPTRHEGYYLKNLSDAEREKYDIVQHNKRAKEQHEQIDQIESDLKEVQGRGRANQEKIKTLQEQIAVSENLIQDLRTQISDLEKLRQQQIEIEIQSLFQNDAIAAEVPAPRPQKKVWGDVADVEKLDEITRFNERLLPKFKAISDFAVYPLNTKLKSKIVEYGIPTSPQDNRFRVSVYDVANASKHVVSDSFRQDYTNYCANVLDAVLQHYSEKETAFDEAFSLNTPKYDLIWLKEQNDLSDSRLNEILEPIVAFSLKSENEVFQTQLEQIKTKQSVIEKAFELAQLHVIESKIQQPIEQQNKPKKDYTPRFEM